MSRGVKLYGIHGDWYEDYEEHGGLVFTQLFTSYRKASMWLLEQGYEIEFNYWEYRYMEKKHITFVKEYDDCVDVVEINEMELIK